MSERELSALYRNYIACLNAQDWSNLGRFVDDTVHYNGQLLGLTGYRRRLESDFQQIPDLRFNIQLLICEPPTVASRLQFACAPRADFLGLKVNGKHIDFAENVFYEFRERKIYRVWSVIDKAAIEAQL